MSSCKVRDFPEGWGDIRSGSWIDGSTAFIESWGN